jgi:two-component system LytT family response regulator
MPILNCVIVDDEGYAIELLIEHINLFPELRVIKTFTDPTKALLEISIKDNIDILFLDIDMPTITGLELGRKLRDKTKFLIYTTAHSEYAIHAFGIKAQDYLLKPIDKVRFIDSIQSVFSSVQSTSKPQLPGLLFIKSKLKGKFLSVKLVEVILIYVEGHKLFIVTRGELYETAESLKNIEHKLQGDSRFMRVHNSNLVNLDKIIKIEGNTIEMEGKYKVPVSEFHKPKLLQIIGMDGKN